MSRLRIVLDANVLISAALKPFGGKALILNLVAFKVVELCVSEAILSEYREVFSRPKFSDLDGVKVSHLLALVEREATLVTPTERLIISKHACDNRFYECADAAGADYLVTGNAKHFTNDYKNTRS